MKSFVLRPSAQYLLSAFVSGFLVLLPLSVGAQELSEVAQNLPVDQQQNVQQNELNQQASQLLSEQQSIREPLTTRQVLESLQQWLIVNNNSGIDLINNSLQKAGKELSACDPRSFLQQVQFIYGEDVDVFYKVNFAYSSLDEYVQGCEYNWYFSNETAGFTPPLERGKYGIYRVPFRMRDLVPALLQDEKVMDLLDKLFDEKAHIEVQIILAKNVDNQLGWVVVLKDVNTGLTYKLKTTASEVEEREFSIYSVK